MSVSDHRRTSPVFTPAEAEVAEWILSGKKKFPKGLDRHLEALVMAKLMLSLSPAQQRGMAEDPDCPPTIREALLAEIATDGGDEDLGRFERCQPITRLPRPACGNTESTGSN